MCLIDTKRFRLSLYPIKIYKVVTENNYSPILNELLFHRNNTHMHNTPFRSANGDNCMGIGFYHSFLTKCAAQRFIKKWPSKENLKIVSGYIPPFVRIGRDNIRKREICSRILILNI